MLNRVRRLGVIDRSRTGWTSVVSVLQASEQSTTSVAGIAVVAIFAGRITSAAVFSTQQASQQAVTLLTDFSVGTAFGAVLTAFVGSMLVRTPFLTLASVFPLPLPFAVGVVAAFGHVASAVCLTTGDFPAACFAAGGLATRVSSISSGFFTTFLGTVFTSDKGDLSNRGKASRSLKI